MRIGDASIGKAFRKYVMYIITYVLKMDRVQEGAGYDIYGCVYIRV